MHFLKASLAAVGVALSATPASACGVVDGSDWAFVAVTPKGWTDACGDRGMQGTAFSLWPSGQMLATADAVIYVTVSPQEGRSLARFREEELATFRAASPRSRITPARPSHLPRGAGQGVVHIANAPGAHDELVAYLEGPNAFYVVALSANSPALEKKYERAFATFVVGFATMERN